MNNIEFYMLFSSAGFGIAALLLVYIGYSIWRDKLGPAPAILRFLKWIAIAFPLAILVNVTIFVGEFAYVNRNACDEIGESPIAINARGDTAEGRIEVCTVIGTVENDYITLQLHRTSHLWPGKKLIDYWPVVHRDPTLQWIDDDTLNVDLGKVYWVSSRLDKVGNIRVVYNYAMVDPPSEIETSKWHGNRRSLFPD
ncbi:MAG: hypothetical protein ACREDM_15255 [Methylocella sp.]